MTMEPKRAAIPRGFDHGPFIPARIAEWAYWIDEREAIRRNREAGRPPPWTDDPVMATTRFCNVRRMDDRVSIWLYENWYKRVKETGRGKDAILAGLSARMINKPETLLHITGGKGVFGRWDYDVFLKRMYQVKLSGKPVFTHAYIINGASGGPKIEQVLGAIAKADARMNVHGATVYLKPTLQETAEALHELPGVGSFIAGQVVADLRWVLPRGWPDCMDWAPVGPGSSRGMKYLLGLMSADGVLGRGNDMSQREFLKNLRLLVKLAERHPVVGPIFRERKLEAHDIQNTLCELGKFVRVGYGLGRPKNFYEVPKGIWPETV